LVTNSNYSQREIEQNMGIPPSRVRVVHHGLEDRFGPVATSEKRRMALSVGVVHRWNLERKGQRAFVEAASRLEDVEFVLAGAWEDDAAETLRELAGPNVTLTGYLDDGELDRRFREATVYVQASWHEGFGLAVAEAMLAGAVPVVTGAGALPEVVGDTGLTIAAPTADDVAAGVSRALEMGPEEGRRARERVLERFPIEARAEGIIAEVEAAAAGATRNL
jgi:glycosyltransferase involved in cell wall biosynthesis